MKKKRKRKRKRKKKTLVKKFTWPICARCKAGSLLGVHVHFHAPGGYCGKAGSLQTRSSTASDYSTANDGLDIELTSYGHRSCASSLAKDV